MIRALPLGLALIAAPAAAQTSYPPTSGATLATAVPMCAEPSIPTGANVVNTATETAFAVTCRVPAGTIQAGTVNRIDSRFRLSVNAVVPSLQGQVYLARSATPDLTTCTTNNQCVRLLNTGAVTGLAAGTGLYGNSDVSCSFQSPTLVECSGQLNFQTTASAVLAISAQSANINAAGITIPWDPATVDSYYVYSAKWSAAQTDNSIQMRQQTLK